MDFKKYDEDGAGSLTYLCFERNIAYCINQQKYAERFII